MSTRTLAQNIAQTKADFKAIKDAIDDRGVPVPAGTPTSQYPEYISQINGGRKEYPIYGVKGLNLADPYLTRTDDSVGLDYTVLLSDGVVVSPFDNLFPWNESEVVEDKAGKFLKMPEMYFRVGYDEEHRLSDIAVSKKASGEGDWYRVKPFMYACYGASIENEKMVSRSGVARSNMYTRAEFREYAANNGSEYHPLDIYHRTVMTLLWHIEFANRRTEQIMTGRTFRSGNLGDNSMRNTGGTDGVPAPSGYDLNYWQMRYHYIEDFYGNTYEFVDGVVCSPEGTPDYVTDNPAKFSDESAELSPLSWNSPPRGVLVALGWDRDKPFLCMPREVAEEDDHYQEYFRDRADNSTEFKPVLFCGAYWDGTGWFYGLMHFNRTKADMPGVGSRLIKRLDGE